MICVAMAVLHITYKHNPQTSRVDYDGFIKSSQATAGLGYQT